jgi:Tol biopolymer transport system component
MIQGNANFSPDGKKVAFNSHASGTGEIWVCGADGSNLSQLTHLDGPRIFGFRWSPNGQDIIFSSASNGKHNLYLVKVDGGRIRRLTDTHFNEHSPSYSRDARWVYFDSDRSGDSQVWKIPAGGGTAVRVTKRGGRNPLESVDGRTLYYLKGKNLFLGDLWKIPATGGEETRVLEGVVLNNFDLNEQGIYYAKPEGNRIQLLFYDFASGKTRRIAPVQQSIDWGLSVSLDARWLLVTQMDGQPSSSDLVLVENFQ